MSLTSAPLTIEQQLDIVRQLCPDITPLIERHAFELPELGRHSPTMQQAYELMESAKSHQATDTIRTRVNIYKRLFTVNPALAEAPLASVTPEQIEVALNACWKHTAVTWNRGLGELSALFSYAIRKRWVNMQNPAAPLDRLQLQESEIYALQPARLYALLEAALISPHHRDLAPYIAICAFAGVRPTECSRLTWADVNMTEGHISVRRNQSKTGGTRHIELHPALHAWLEFARPQEAAPADPIIPKVGKGRLYRLRRAAGFSPQNPWQEDCLRHSYATYYLLAGGTLSQLQLNMGHSSTQLLHSRYVNMKGVTRAHARAWWKITPEYIINRRRAQKKSMPLYFTPAA